MKTSIKQALQLFLIASIVFFAHKMFQNHLGQAAINSISFPIHQIDEAIQLASEKEKLILADYSAVWCPSCRKLSKNVFANNEVAAAITKGYIYARLDADTQEGQEFANKHDLFGFPRVLVLNPNGEKLLELPLTFDPIEYEINLRKVEEAFEIY